jgi:23S rRNA G2445 N2-methylase RlmL
VLMSWVPPLWGVQNAVVDQWRDAFGKRPSVNPETPDLPLIVYLHRNEAVMYRSLSGLYSMHKR